MTPRTKTLTQNLDVATFGQVFTPAAVVKAMLALKRNQGRVLEPSCGDGAFSNHIKQCVAIELDGSYRHRHINGSLNIDFFAYPTHEQFDTIIGNPPYVRFQNILPSTLSLINSQRFDRRSNLYLFFIEKCLQHLKPHGELIFITPRDFLKSTASIELNKWLYSLGSITHAIELGDAKIFRNALPNCLIWRFEKDLFSRQTRYFEISLTDDINSALIKTTLPEHWQMRFFVESQGHLIFASESMPLSLKDVATVKVGAVSGADRIFTHDKLGNKDFVHSKTAKTGTTKKMIWIDPTLNFTHHNKADNKADNEANDKARRSYLALHKTTLMARGIRAFNESNWWHWGRGYPITEAPRLYVNAKTRRAKPFFMHDCLHFDGSILAIFPHNPTINRHELCEAMNLVDWQQLGFVCDGRYLFTQRSLENTPLPAHFEKFCPKK